MLDRNKLNGAIAEAGKTKKDVAKAIGKTPKTFTEKMKKGVFGSDEIEVMCKFLNIQNPTPIFFCSDCQPTVENEYTDVK